MQPADFRIRRAVVDDLPGLLTLWRSMNFSTGELEKRLTEFQVAENAGGELVGALGLDIAGQQARLHHEAYTDFALADRLRPLFWDKLLTLLSNNGVFRVWTQEDAPFWGQLGLLPASRETLQKLPAKWSAAGGTWRALQLKEDAAIQALTGNGEMERLMSLERESTRKMLEQARMIKIVATILSIILALLVGMLILYAFRRDPAVFEQLRR
jgi:hypothetical protein